MGNLIVVVAGAKVSTGSYNGDNTQNRAIAHGLGSAPKLIVIQPANTSGAISQKILGTNAFSCEEGTTTQTAVTAIDGTNFYVGGVSGVPANVTGKSYYWTAIG